MEYTHKPMVTSSPLTERTSTVTQSTLFTEATSTNKTGPIEPEYHTLLMAINCVVLVIGTISLSLTMHILNYSSTSSTSIAVLNLIFAHFIFLITVPFRIYYYVTNTWTLGHSWCKVVSSMIHIHMYMSFIFYVIILITRLLAFYNKGGQLHCFQRIHALLLSTVVWAVVLVMVPCIIHFYYGQNSTPNGSTCFKFGTSIGYAAKLINYIISIVIIVVATVLTVLQAYVVWDLYKRHPMGCNLQQDFWAQLKSLFFALIMVVSFIPYHIFRFYYLENIDVQNLNEVFLSLTTFNCLDMLNFMGRRNWYMCCLGKISCM
ncbi:probable G-protein coupled receptor 141 isoform X2 [Echeneis naucrates]|uniref:probable G-protein coupled receptor 141 isoform X2 n=1 Tax=Echeneis naucrates TaxID=173247 RepID=UPI001114401B|nr:probable G-protein coupled receptor 141 isoform X2 [Echeneis naucrates]